MFSMRRFAHFCKCAISVSLAGFQALHRGGDFPQAHLRYVARRKAERVHRVFRVEVHDELEIFIVEIVAGFDAAPAQQHESRAVLDGGAESGLDVEAVQFIEEAAVEGLHKLT